MLEWSSAERVPPAAAAGSSRKRAAAGKMKMKKMEMKMEMEMEMKKMVGPGALARRAASPADSAQSHANRRARRPGEGNGRTGLVRVGLVRVG